MSHSRSQQQVTVSQQVTEQVTVSDLPKSTNFIEMPGLTFDGWQARNWATWQAR